MNGKSAGKSAKNPAGKSGENDDCILIVEDEGVVALHIRMILKKDGYNVCGVAPSGEKALELLKVNNTGLVLMDIKLKGQMDGIETAAHIKSDYNIPVIYVTAHNDKETIARAEKTDPVGYISKPLINGKLQKVIRKVMKPDLVEDEDKEPIG